MRRDGVNACRLWKTWPSTCKYPRGHYAGSWQLAAEGVRFQQLQDSLRHRRALELLRRNELTIDEIADALGYSDPSNFGRAFRKWEGLSPSAWRRTHQKP